MKSNWKEALHAWFKTETALVKEVRKVEYRDVDLSAHLCESMFYDQDFVFDLSRTESHLVRDSGLSGRRTLSSAVQSLIKLHDPSRVQRLPVAAFHGIASSKSHGCRSLEELAYRLKPPCEYPSSNLIRFETEEDFRRNIAEVEREFSNRGVVALYREWDGKLFVRNGDMSHHLAAIYRQCKEQGRQYYLDLRVQVLGIDPSNCRFILDNSYPLIIQEQSRYQLCRILERFGIEWHSSSLSKELSILYVLKSNKRAEAAYGEIAHVGSDKFFDLKKYLEELLLSCGTAPYYPKAG